MVYGQRASSLDFSPYRSDFDPIICYELPADVNVNRVFCSALSATIVANLQIEIGSYFRAGSLVRLSLFYHIWRYMSVGPSYTTCGNTLPSSGIFDLVLYLVCSRGTSNRVNAAQSSWLGTAYLLGLTALTPLYGRLALVMGRKGAMLLALGFFFSTSQLLNPENSSRLRLCSLWG